MPRGGKKKKKAARNRNSNARERCGKHGNNVQPATTNFAQGSTKRPPMEVVVPPSFEAFQESGKVLPDNYRTVYFRYKAATKRVFEYLQENTPRENIALSQNNEHTIMHVSSLVAAADWMAEAQIPVDPDILKDLKFAIRVRSKVARSVYGGGDSGHKHLLDTLVYCWKVLDSLPRAEKKTITMENIEEKLPKNRFEALEETAGELEDEEEDCIMDEELFSSRDVPRPDLDHEVLPLQDLLDAEDRMDACFFLMTLDSFMRCVSEQHSNVLKWAGEDGAHESAIVPVLLGPTIATNMAIQQVQRLEIEFELQNPHINTPYRLLAIVLFPELVNDVVQVTREHGHEVCSARDANIFLGDCLECSFRHKHDPENNSPRIVSDFCSRFEIDNIGSKVIDKLFFDIRCYTILEVPLKHEFEMAEDTGSASHVWLNPEIFEYIGRDRSIHHTLRLLQWFGMVAKPIPEGQIVNVSKGFFGSSPWQPGRSNKIHNDLDELLMAEILPNWFWICRDGMLNNGTEPPRQSELAPLWSCIRRFARSPEKPVRWSTLFAVHAILTSILETDKIGAELALVCQETFDSYFQQLDIACEHKKGMDGSFDSSLFQPGMTVLQYFKRLGDPFFGRALWNPLCAGTSLLYLNYQANVGFGSALIDDRSQLKIVLHLYHALIVNDILQPGDIPFLDCLYYGFEKSKALWGESLPARKGNLVEQFWRSMRGRLSVCEKFMAKLSRLDDTVLSNQDHLETIEALCKSEKPVAAGMMNPAEFSKSFRRICNRDYHDVVDGFHSKEVRQKASGDDVYEFAVQLNDTTRAYVKEHQLFAFNLPACGVYLDEFVCRMSHFFQWDQLFKGALNVENTRLEHSERVAEAYMFPLNVLGTLDQAKDPSKFDRIKGFVAFFMCPFFEKLSIEGSCIWFQGSGSREERMDISE